MIRREFNCLSTLVEQTDSTFHSLYIRRRSLWKDKPLEQILLAARIAMILSPGYANGRPLRTLSVAGTDTKFFERDGRLITALLDARFDNEVSEIGLEVFLGAYNEGDHWLLVMDLDSSLLPFSKQRVGSSELQRAPLPGARLLLVENESCQHQLPRLPGAIAVLGTGFDLQWTAAAWLRKKNVAYWGDIDTWGLQFLGKARQTVGENLHALMMTAEVYEQHKTSAVTEPIVAGTELPNGLTSDECTLYRRLLAEPCGRLEQEYLPITFVQSTILEWALSCST
jgi:hypothetical protein